MYRFSGLGAAQNYPAIDAAIAQFETGGSPTSIGSRNNNPGNLVYSSWMAQFGCTTGGAGGFALCPSPDAGQQILDYRVSQLVNQGDSVSELIDTWASPSYPGNTQASYQNYVNYVAGQTGLDPNSPISDQISGSVADTGAIDTADTGTVDLSGSGTNWTVIGLAAGAGVLLLWALS